MSASSLNTEGAGSGAPRRRGKLKIFLGYAAGTGKTYRMLEEAQRLKASGVDVVVGYFEPHGRKETIAKTEGLEFVPRQRIYYRGSEFEDMDTAAILRRRPAVCVVDELAHTNVPGSERKKRWEDVAILRATGIDVLTSLNIQHLESLNDQVWHVTGIRVRETIPDWVVQEADELEMVDLTPRALIHRLERGVVYGPEKAQQALENFFTEGNLTALREIALRQTAQQIEDQIDDAVSPRIQTTRRAEKSDRFLVVISPEPHTAMLIRRGKRVADYLHSECFGIFVANDPRWSSLSPEEREAVERHLNFSKLLRIEVQVVIGTDLAQTVLDFAREHQIRQIFISRGNPAATRLVRLAKDMVITVVSERTRQR